MILCLDVGNSQVYGGLFDDGRLSAQFRRTSLALIFRRVRGLLSLGVAGKSNRS